MLNEMGLSMPACVDIERLILGNAFLGDRNTFDVISAALTVDDFSLDRHRTIFRAMHALLQEGSCIDRLTVAQYLVDHKLIDRVGGLEYLSQVQSEGLLTNIDSHLRDVKQAADRRNLIQVCEVLQERCFDQANPLSDIVGDAQDAMNRVAQGSASQYQFSSPTEIIDDMGGVSAYFHRTAQTGVKTPFDRLDYLTNGLQGGQYVVIAARTAVGKSILGLQFALAAAQQKVGVAYFSLEMPQRSLVDRLIANVANVNMQHIKSGSLSKEERARIMKEFAILKNLPIYIEGNKARSLPAMRLALRKLATTRRCGMIIIDHLHLMESTGHEEKEYQLFGNLSTQLKHLAMEFDIPIVVLAQLNQDSEGQDREPRRTDVGRSGRIAEDADMLLLVHRPEVYRPERLPLTGKTKLIVAKQRDGEIGVVRLKLHHGYQRFTEWPDGEMWEDS